MPPLHVNGIHLFYDEAGAGLPVIFVHAYPMGRRMWAPQMAHFQGRYRVIAYDCRGFGDSEAPSAAEHYSQELSVEDLKGLCRGLHLGRAAIVGLSMGGNIALHLALRHPAVVAGVVICDTGAGSDDPALFGSVTEGWAVAAEQGGIQDFTDAVLRHPVFAGYASRGAAEAEAMQRMITAHPTRGLAHTARETLAKRPPIFALEGKLRALSVPALILVGERDLPCIGPSEYMAERIPNAQLHLMEGCGHFSNLERPAEFSRVVEAFFRKIGWDA